MLDNIARLATDDAPPTKVLPNEDGDSVSARRISTMLAIVVAGIYLLSSLLISAHRHFWYDEILTVLIARLPTIRSIWDCVATGNDLSPPTYFMVVRFCEGLFGHSEVVARIPSAVGMAIGMVLVFDCAKRACGSIFALGAIGALCCSFLPYFGYEARPYGLYFLVAAIQLWLWLNTSPRSKAASVLFGIAVLAGFSFHYFSAYCLLPYVVQEWRDGWRPWKVPTAKLVSAIVAGGVGLIVFRAQLAGARQFSKYFWSPPSFNRLRDVFGQVFPFGLLVVAIAILWLAARRKASQETVASMTRSERLGWFFLLVPILGYVAGVAGTGAFVARHFIGMLPGIALAAACALKRGCHETRRSAIVFMAFVLSLGLVQQLRLTLNASKVVPMVEPAGPAKLRELLSWESKFAADGRTTIVGLADGMGILEAKYYGDHPENYALLVTDNMAMGARIHRNLSKYYPLRFLGIHDITTHAHEIALVDPPYELILDLSRAGLTPRLVARKENEIYYLD